MDRESVPTAQGGVPIATIEARAKRIHDEAVIAGSLLRRGQSAATSPSPSTLEGVLHSVLEETYASGGGGGNSKNSSSSSDLLVGDRAPFALKTVPTLAAMADRQLRLTTKVMCAVATRPVVTLHELETEICLEEGVTSFADLGLGHGLQCLPIAQQYFQVTDAMDVFPVASQQVIEFLLTSGGVSMGGASASPNIINNGAASISAAPVDARAVINGFRSYYEAHYCSGLNGQPRRSIENPRQLGVHIQSLSWLTAVLDQEAADRARAVRAAVDRARAVFARNASLYTGVIAALDARLVATTAPGDFTVVMPEESAAVTSVPLTLWQSSDSAEGGVSLSFSVGQRKNAVVVQTTTTLSFNAALPVLTVPPTVSAAPTVVPAAPRRRGCGAVIRDEGMAVEAPAAAAAVPPPIAVGSSLSSLRAQANTVVAPTLTACAPTTITKADACPMELLYSYADGSEALEGYGAASPTSFVDGALVRLKVSQVVSTETLRRGFARLARQLTAAEEAQPGALQCFLGRVVNTAFIPVPHPERSGSGDDDAGLEVVAMARPRDIQWCSDLLAVIKRTASYSSSTAAAMAAYYHTDASALFFLPEAAIAVLRHGGSDPRVDFISPWALSVQVNRRIACTATRRRFGTDGEEQFMMCMTAYYEAAFELCLRGGGVVTGPSDDNGSTAEAALASLLGPAMDASLTTTHQRLFLLNGTWRRPADGLYYGGPGYWGYSSLHLRPPASSSQELPALRTGALSFAMGCVLSALGCRSLDQEVCRRVTFESLRPGGGAALLLHRALAVAAPYVQSLLCSASFEYYTLAFERIARRLAAFRVVVGRGARLTEKLVQANANCGNATGSTVYSCARAIRLSYTAEHHTLYAEDGDFSPAVLAEALLSVFLPFAPLSRDRDRVEVRMNQLLDALMRVFLSFTESSEGDVRFSENAPLLTGGDASPQHEALMRALDAAAAEFGAQYCGGPVRRYTPDTDDAQRGPGHHARTLPAAMRAAFIVSPIPPARQLLHFPPGCDGLGQPSVRTPPPHRQQHHQADASPALTGGASGMSNSDLTRAARHLPEWGSAWLHEQRSDALAAALQCLRERPPQSSARATAGESQRQTRRLEPTATGRRVVLPSSSSCSDDEGDMGGIIHFKKPRRQHRDTAAPSAMGGPWYARTFVSTDGTSTANDTTGPAMAAERFVYDTLKRQYEQQDHEQQQQQQRHQWTNAFPCARHEVVWMNESSERGAPYDIVVLRNRPNNSNSSSGGGGQWEVADYIEVKSTVSNDRRDFELSIRELVLAARYGLAYKVYRVFGASASPMRRMRFTIYEDLLRQWYAGAVTLTGDIRAAPSQ